MNSTRNRAVSEYLRELQRSMRDLPAPRREEILAEIKEHITTGLSESPGETDADVRNVLERLGDPYEIAAEARDRLGLRHARRRTPWKLIGGVLVLIVVAAIVGAFLTNSDGSRHAITEDQFSRVGIGDSKERVSQALAGPGEGGSKVSGLDPQAVEVELRPGQEQYDDCWSYSVEGPSVGPGAEAAVCFIADEVVYTVFLSD